MKSPAISADPDHNVRVPVAADIHADGAGIDPDRIGRDLAVRKTVAGLPERRAWPSRLKSVTSLPGAKSWIQSRSWTGPYLPCDILKGRNMSRPASPLRRGPLSAPNKTSSPLSPWMRPALPRKVSFPPSPQIMFRDWPLRMLSAPRLNKVERTPRRPSSCHRQNCPCPHHFRHNPPEGRHLRRPAANPCRARRKARFSLHSTKADHLPRRHVSGHSLARIRDGQSLRTCRRHHPGHADGPGRPEAHPRTTWHLSRVLAPKHHRSSETTGGCGQKQQR